MIPCSCSTDSRINFNLANAVTSRRRTTNKDYSGYTPF